MKRSTILIVLTFCGVLAAVQVPAQTGPEVELSTKASKSQCPKMAFSAVEKPQAMGRSFSAARSADLVFHVLFDRSLEEERVVTLKVFTPNGHLYRRFDVPLASGNENSPESARHLPGYPYPVRVPKPKTVKVNGRKFESVDVLFPVAGSTIITSSLYGRWNVEVFLDDAPDPCGKPTFFHLKE